MDDKKEKNFTKHYAWVSEYNRELIKVGNIHERIEDHE